MTPGSNMLGTTMKTMKSNTKTKREKLATGKEQHALSCRSRKASGASFLAGAPIQRVRLRQVPAEGSTVRASDAMSAIGTRISMMMIMTRQK